MYAASLCFLCKDNANVWINPTLFSKRMIYSRFDRLVVAFSYLMLDGTFFSNICP